MKKFFFIFLSIILFSSCNKKDKTQLRLSLNMHPSTLDARKCADVSSSIFLFMLSKGLTEFKEDGTVGPSVAKSYEISEDKKTYIFHLRDSKWSDGTDVTAYDFEYSWKKILDPKFPSLCPHLLYPIVNAEKAVKGKVPLDDVGFYAKDKKTFVVKLSNPTPYFLSITSFCLCFPVKKGIDETCPNWENDVKKYISNGPFKLKKIDYNKEIIVEKNPFYWDKNSISLNSIKVSIIDSENTTLQMFENGELDWVGAYSSPLPVDSIPYLLKKKEHSIHSVGGTTFCSFNLEKFPFNNKNIRKAFGLSMDRKSIVENITQAKELIATRIIPPFLMNGKNLILYKDNDIEKALKHLKKGLKELNVKKEDINITFTFGSDIIHKKLAEAIQQNWQKTLDINIKLEQLEEKVIISRMHKHDFQIGLFWWLVQYNDATNILDRFQYKTNIKNYPNWENEDYIKALEMARTEINPKKRIEYLEQAEKIIVDDMPLSPIYHHNFITLTNPKVKGLYTGPIAELHYDKVHIER